MIGIFAGWWLRKPAEDERKVAQFLKMMAPKLSTDADLKAVTVDKGRAKISGLDMPVTTVLNVRPVLEPESNMDASHLSVVNTPQRRRGQDSDLEPQGKHCIGARLAKRRS